MARPSDFNLIYLEKFWRRLLGNVRRLFKRFRSGELDFGVTEQNYCRVMMVMAWLNFGMTRHISAPRKSWHSEWSSKLCQYSTSLLWFSRAHTCSIVEECCFFFMDRRRSRAIVGPLRWAPVHPSDENRRLAEDCITISRKSAKP
jgi:hypothetical protein